MEIKEFLYSPLAVFGVITLFIAALSFAFSRLVVKGKENDRSLDSYACGQRSFKDYVNPDYSQFFSFAFIFTVVHVLTMVVATAPRNMSLLPVVYILAGFYVITIALRR